MLKLRLGLRARGLPLDDRAYRQRLEDVGDELHPVWGAAEVRRQRSGVRVRGQQHRHPVYSVFDARKIVDDVGDLCNGLLLLLLSLLLGCPAGAGCSSG